MSKHVSGIGGVFFRSKDPEAMGKWYKEHFGIDIVGQGPPWQQEGGMTVFSPFQESSDYFPAEQQVMMNFRLKDIDSFLKELEAKDVKIDPKREDSEYGRFAWCFDPEGRKIELWEPPKKEFPS